MTVTRYKVQGMTCGSCVSTVKATVGSVPGVQAVEVDLATGTVTATGEPSEESVIQAISRAGYEVVADLEPVGVKLLPLADGAGGCCCA